MKVHLIMPMAGAGSRFLNCGYNLPKPLIPIQDKPFFYWAVKSITKFIDVDLTFVVLKEHIVNNNIDQEIKKYFPESNIIVLDKILNGALLTCLQGIRNINDDFPIIFNDCDHAFKCEEFYKYCNNKIKDYDGLILTFESDEDKYSYIKLNNDNLVIKTIEKEVISNHAICGVYYFKNKTIFLKAADEYLQKCNYKEYFVSGIYNVLIENKLKVGHFDVDYHLSFGTPSEYQEAKNSFLFKELL